MRVQVDGRGLAVAAGKGHLYKDGSVGSGVQLRKGIKGIIKLARQSSDKTGESKERRKERKTKEKEERQRLKETAERDRAALAAEASTEEKGGGSIKERDALALPAKLIDSDSMQFHAVDPSTATSSANLDSNLRRRPISGSSYEFAGVCIRG